MSEILLINPRKRRTSRKRNAKGRFVKSVSRKRAPARKRVSRRRNPAVLAANPRRRSRARAVARRVTRRRRNPVRARGVVAQLMPAVKGAAGAVVTDIAYRFLPTPGPLAMLKGPLAPVTRIGVAFGISKLASFVIGKKNAGEMLSGALTVIAYGLINEHVLSRLPVIGVGEYISGLGYQDAAMTFDPAEGVLPDPGMVDYGDENVAEYISGMSM